MKELILLSSGTAHSSWIPGLALLARNDEQVFQFTLRSLVVWALTECRGGSVRTFDEILTQVIDLLQRDGRVSYRALKLRFEIDDEYIEGLKDEFIAAKKLAVDEEGKVLVWVGEGGKGETAKRRNGESRSESLDTCAFSGANSCGSADGRRAQNHHGVVC
jgi:hypothetical protein